MCEADYVSVTSLFTGCKHVLLIDIKLCIYTSICLLIVSNQVSRLLCVYMR